MMGMSIVHINLARKWRSRTFDDVIGQDLSLRILKNSLYLNHYFPVYLFAGQHGCGKTTTARIFAAAVNCEQLPLFQEDPKKYSIPCLTCRSCQAMQAGSHPDFIEVDGASHTGVDNVRHIIDVSAFLPLMGRKKIYLIDEAHMLSKAAFNAFLKILEEPPTSVLFMLATTELNKIIDTVRSRCFQLFFRAVDEKILLKHLERMCVEEKINFDSQGLLVIIKQTKGSVRDAINLLEQVRFESNLVTKKTVLNVLGYTDDETVITLFEKVISRQAEQLLQYVNDNALDKYSIDMLWKSLIELINACIWISYDLVPNNFTEYHERLRIFAKQRDTRYFNECLKLLYEYELAFVKTASRWHLFEMLLLEMCSAAFSLDQGGALPHKPTITGNDFKKSREITAKPITSSLQNVQTPKVFGHDDKQLVWESFIVQIELFDPLLSSVFKQGRYGGFDTVTNTLTVIFAKEFTFFNEMLENSSNVWKPLLASLIGRQINVNAVFQEGEHKGASAEKSQPVVYNKELNNQKQSTQVHQPKQLYEKNIEKKPMPQRVLQEASKATTIDTSDKEQWKKATLLKSLFSGTIQELQEERDE
jgi:DNA polymerase III subunit gamma/tau